MKKLEKTIDKLLKEYTGTGAGGGNATDGNDIPSPRIGGSFENDKKELDDYTRKNVYGAEGNHYRKDSDPFNYERTKMGMFELKDFIKKIVQEIELEEEAYPHPTLTTQGPPRTRTRVPTDEYPFSALPKRTATGMMEQITQDEMDSFNDEKVGYQKKIADVDIRIAQQQKKGIAAALQQQTSQTGPQLDQIEQNMYQANQDIKDKKLQIVSLENRIEELTVTFQESNIENEELRAKLVEEISALEGQLDTTNDELDGLEQTRIQLNQQRDQILNAKSQAQAAASTQTKAADAAIRDQKKARNQIGKAMEENILKQYFKERVNVNLMEQMDSYRENIRGSLQKFFEMFEDGKTNEEVLQYYAKKGIKIPESYISKTKKSFENYKQLKLELSFLDTEAKDFKKIPVMEDEPFEEKKLASNLFKEEKKEKKEKKSKKDKKNNSTIDIDTDEVEVLDDVESVDSITINIKETIKKELLKYKK